MWLWRAFIFSLSIALFPAIASPARTLDSSPQTHSHSAYSLADVHSEFTSSDNSNSVVNQTQQTHGLLSGLALFEGKKPSNKLPDNHNGGGKGDDKTPAYQVRFNDNVSLPPFERQAVSAFGSVAQNEPIFVLIYEFLPEILDLKHFLAPLNSNSAVPWYLRADAPNSHSRLGSWKDGNSLYTGTITYLS